MTRSSRRSQSPARQSRAILVQRLNARFLEIEDAVRTRVYAVSAPTEPDDPDYQYGLQAAVRSAIEYGLLAIESGEKHPPPIPLTLLSQARLAARHTVGLDTVMRRYLAGYTLLSSFLIHEVEQGGELGREGLAALLRSQAVIFDQLLTALGKEYSQESQIRLNSPDARRAAQVRGLLAGELIDTSDLHYDFDAHHVGVVAKGLDASTAIRRLAAALEGRLLLIRPNSDTIWAWIGRREPPGADELNKCVEVGRSPDVFLALGEPGAGPNGWRLTHRQATAALVIALRTSSTFCRYADVALVASVVGDELLSTSLRILYLTPLEHERNGGLRLRDTLSAYFAAERNQVSAAAKLGVTRQTIANHLQAVEEKLGRPLSACAIDLEVALRLEELSDAPRADVSSRSAN